MIDPAIHKKGWTEDHIHREETGCGTEGLENRQIFQTPEVREAGGLAALQTEGNPRDLLIETKTRMFAV